MNDRNSHGPVEIEVDELPELDQVAAFVPPGTVPAVQTPPMSGSRFGRWTGRLAVGFAGLVLGVWIWDFVTGLLARSPALGGIAAFLAGALILLVSVIVLREVAAIGRLNRIGALRSASDEARASGEAAIAQSVLDRLLHLYDRRPDMDWNRNRILEARPALIDGADILDLAERTLLQPLDRRALHEVERSTARVATITALVPLALVDVLTALYANVTMIRRVTEIYGGRGGALGAWRLTRAVVAHLAATGAVAAGDDLIGSALGGSVLSKLSRRFGEGLVNGALTARVGIAAIELCRPMAFVAEPRPRVAATLRRSLTGLFQGERGK